MQEELAREQEAAREMAAGYDAKVRGAGRGYPRQDQWARDVEAALTADVQKQTADLVAAVEALHHTEKELEERTAWALRLQEEARAAGAAAGAGPRVALGEAGPQGRAGPGAATELTWPFLKRFLARAAAAGALAVPGGDRALLALALTDLLVEAVRARARPREAPTAQSRTRSAAARASVVIPNWNGKDLLEKYLPSVVAALAGNPGQRNHRGR